ncbi:MAG: ATP-binding protein [Gaiellales bacterium]
MNGLVERLLEPVVLEAMDSARVTAIVGPRQAGKTTLVRSVAAKRGLGYVTLDDDTVRRAAADDPPGFVSLLAPPIAIDEVQRVPELMLALKRVVDDRPDPGSFLITGSSNLQTSSRIADALPGRVDYLELGPFSERELERGSGSVVDRLFAEEWAPVSVAELGRTAIADRVVIGGFPEARLRPERARARFFDGYVRSMVEREAADASSLRTLDRLGDTFRLVVSRSGASAEPYVLGSELGLDGRTAASHVQVLEQLFAIRSLPAWSTNLGARVTRAHRLYVADSGLHAAMLGVDRDAFVRDLDGRLAGPLTETFVVNEILRQAAWAETPTRASYYRDNRQREIDMILEAGRRVVAIEIKSAASASAMDARHLAFLRDRIGDRFVRGFVLYTGEATVALGDRLVAAPIGSLWAP